jgi:hypothetical protein
MQIALPGIGKMISSLSQIKIGQLITNQAENVNSERWAVKQWQPGFREKRRLDL